MERNSGCQFGRKFCHHLLAEEADEIYSTPEKNATLKNLEKSNNFKFKQNL